MMGLLPKVTLFMLFGAATLHQGDATLLSWRRWPLSNFGHPVGRSLQGPSSLAMSLWDDFDDFWPTLTHDMTRMNPNSALQVPNMQHERSCQGGWVKYDENSDIEKQLDAEELKLQQKDDQLRRERKHLQDRRESHQRDEKNRKHESEQQRILRDEQLRRERLQQHQLRREQEERQRQEEVRRAERQRDEQLRRERLQRQRDQEERRQREEARRVERQREELRRKKEEERRRQEEIIRAREERKLAEEQQRLERERHERIRRDEMERQRLVEERELRRRQQQESAERQRQRQMEEQRRQQTQQDSFREENVRHKSSRSLPRSDIEKLTIPEGYNLEDITVETVGNQAFVKGHHVCGCDEKCYDREFERRIPLPKNVDTRTISANLYPGGTLTLQGVKSKQVVRPVDTLVTVEGAGLPQRTSVDACKKMNKLKPSGFKLKKMNARTGEVFDDIQVLEDSYPKFETEVDDDGLTIEVVDY